MTAWWHDEPHTLPPRMVICADWDRRHPNSTPMPPVDTGETCYLDPAGRWWLHSTLVDLNTHASVLDAIADAG